MDDGAGIRGGEQIPGSKVRRGKEGGRGRRAIVYLGSLRSREPRNSIATNSGRGYYSAVKFYFASIYWSAFAKPDLSPYAPVYLITTNYCYEKKRRSLLALLLPVTPRRSLQLATRQQPLSAAPPVCRRTRRSGKRGLKARGWGPALGLSLDRLSADASER